MTGNDEKTPLEIERKYLIRMPDPERLARESTKRIEITQIYLKTDAFTQSRRLRHSRWADGEARYFTEKVHLTDRTRIEREREITREEWDALLPEADETRRVIEKVRWCVPSGSHMLEIDVFPFWTDRAFCEVELRSEDERFVLPDWIETVREVTDDRRYTNSALALSIPREEIGDPGQKRR